MSGYDGLCPNCFNQMTFISEPHCRKCGHPFEPFAVPQKMLCAACLKNKRSPFRFSRSALVYDEASKPLLLSFKFYDKTENAAVLAQFLQVAGQDIFKNGVDMIVPVPLHYVRLIKRRYNQAALLAKELSRLSGVPAEYGVLVRSRHTRPQTEFSGNQRVKNVRNAFAVKNPQRVKGKHVLLIDDVMTTGSTLKECALALRRAGAASVDTLTVARVC